nr:hypothetical protein [Pseudorhizobium flavum]
MIGIPVAPFALFARGSLGKTVRLELCGSGVSEKRRHLSCRVPRRFGSRLSAPPFLAWIDGNGWKPR